MPRLPIIADYPKDWPQINAAAKERVGHRCIRCHHPYKAGAWSTGEWSDCDSLCTHNRGGFRIHNGQGQAQWRILTVHHFDGDKSNCNWWNLLALCQRCHLEIQGRVNPQTPYFLEHSDWIKPYVAGFYAFKYQGRLLTIAEVAADLEQLLNLERLA